MNTRMLERQGLHRMIDELPDAAIERMAHYADFLRYAEEIEELEDADDIAFIDSLTPEDYANAIPESEVIAEHEARYGPLDSIFAVG